MKRSEPACENSASANASVSGVKAATAAGGRSIGAGTSEIRRMPIGRELFDETKWQRITQEPSRC